MTSALYQNRMVYAIVLFLLGVGFASPAKASALEFCITFIKSLTVSAALLAKCAQSPSVLADAFYGMYIIYQ
ncbi:MAG: hypothetical protein ACO1PI_03015 [Bacteroidota bacterium]|jgi:hypothetical protein